MTRVSALTLAAALVALSACFTPSGSSVEQKRANILEMRTQALDQLYAANPALRSRVERAAEPWRAVPRDAFGRDR